VTHFQEIDSLSLLAHKVAANVFDLSTSQINVSIRDQMVRAQQLVVDLKAADPGARCLLIVGMGVAGMTAALTASEAGFDQVYAVETRDMPFALFNGVRSRFVGPYMYEWPSPFYANQSYPLNRQTPWTIYGKSPLAWRAARPISAHELGKRLRSCVRRWRKAFAARACPTPLPVFLVEADRKGVAAFIKDFARIEAIRAVQDTAGEARSDKARYEEFGRAREWECGKKSVLPRYIEPDYVILAAGMGDETVTVPGVPVAASAPFWSNDGLKQNAVTGQRVVVLGGGDGAIQDTFRALTEFDHPVEFIRMLEDTPKVRQALHKQLPTLLSADRQLRQHTSWARDSAGFVMVDRACRLAARELAKSPSVVKAVLTGIRKGTGEVIHLVRGWYFDKCYLLNRFLIYLFAECLVTRAVGTKHMGFALVFGREVKQAWKVPSVAGPASWRLEIGHRRRKHGCTTLINIDELVVRFGIQPGSVPGPRLVQLDDSYPGHRTMLNRVELPFVAMRKT